MLIALLISLLLGGGASAFLDYVADSEDAVKTVMVKDERQKDALNLLKSMKKRSKAHNKEVKKTVKELSELVEVRENEITEIAAIGDRHLENIESYNSDILDLRYELKEQITREEWAQIFPEEDPR